MTPELCTRAVLIRPIELLGEKNEKTKLHYSSNTADTGQNLLVPERLLAER